MPVIRAICALSASLGFVGSAFNSGFVLLAYTPLYSGGLSLSVRLLPPPRPAF